MAVRYITPLNYSYAWKYNGGAYSNDLNINNLSAGSYELTVSVNGCSSTSSTFVIQEPKTTIGTASFTCDRKISLPVTSYFTPTQMAIASPKLKGTLYELAVDGTYTSTVTTQEFVASTATSTFVFDFGGIVLDEGEKYKVDIYDLFCNNFNSIIVGPVDKALAIDESQITTVDEECIGERGSILIANGAISGVSGSYLYNWTNITDNTTYFTRDVVGASDGTYTLTITDQLRNCTYTIATNVVVLPAGPTIAASWATATNITVNQCADGRLGRLEIVPSGGGGTYSYEWEFTPATASGTISSTIQISNNSGKLTPGSASEIPASMSTTGDYKVYIYDGNISDGCPALEQSISITGPIPVSLTSSLTFSNIICSGENNGTIEFTVAKLNQNTTGSAATLTTARTIHGVSFDGSADIDLTEVVQDTVGAMVGSNTETGISVTYEDGDGTLDFVVGTLNQDTTGNAATATALETARTIHGVSFDGTGNIDLTEVVQDTVGAMFSSNTETGITVGYEDGDGTIDLAVGTLNQNTTGSAATLTTARTIALSGDVAGSVTFDGSANATISTTVQANSVALGTDTTGNYMTEIAGGTGVSVSHTAGEGSTATLSIGQAVATNSDVTFADIAATDLTLSGNLTVNGTTTTASSTNTVIADTLIELGNGTSGTPANDSGFVIERGSADNAFIGFDESADKFTMGTGSFTGASTGNLTISTGTLVANLEGNVTGNVTGNTSGTAGGLSGTPNISVGTIASGAITITNATNSGGTARNVYQSTSAPGGSDGAVGDLWVLYS